MGCGLSGLCWAGREGGFWGGYPPPPGEVPKVFETGVISPNGSLLGFGLVRRLVRCARGCRGSWEAMRVKRRDFWWQGRAGPSCIPHIHEKLVSCAPTAGPSTAPLAVTLREASLRMTLIFRRGLRNNTSRILAGNGNVETCWSAVSLRSIPHPAAKARRGWGTRSH
jgi:hypothetical protein